MPLGSPFGELACAARLRGYQRQDPQESLGIAALSVTAFPPCQLSHRESQGRVLRWYDKPHL